MGTMTINVNDTVEHSFRALINKQSGTRKGSLGKAVEKALADFIRKQQQEDIRQKAIWLMEHGFSMGEKMNSTRDELHER